MTNMLTKGMIFYGHSSNRTAFFLRSVRIREHPKVHIHHKHVQSDHVWTLLTNLARVTVGSLSVVRMKVYMLIQQAIPCCHLKLWYQGAWRR